ncbi:MAG: F0F1 ATP synthase subunit A [Thermoleophilaceae bacterium]|nr:F0F1 ATP synthase subunit A [Thermoleophilaceae bacterium]
MSLLRTAKSRSTNMYWALLLPIIALLASPTVASAIEINEDFKPQNEFKLDPWVSIHIGPVDMSLNKGVMLVVMAGVLSVVTLTMVANRMKIRDAGRLQTVVEMGYNLTYENITRGNVEDAKIAKRWFPFFATLFFFIWFSNMLGFIPMPTNTEHTVNIFGIDMPTFALYASTANISVPLALALVVWLSYHYEGIRAKGFFGYVKSWIPNGVSGPVMLIVVPVEILSQFVRLISLSARLFANMLAGHMLILIMGGGMVVLLGMVGVSIVTIPIGVMFFIFEVGLISSLQAFIFATLSAMYMGGAVAHDH